MDFYLCILVPLMSESVRRAMNKSTHEESDMSKNDSIYTRFKRLKMWLSSNLGHGIPSQKGSTYWDTHKTCEHENMNILFIPYILQ